MTKKVPFGGSRILDPADRDFEVFSDTVASNLKSKQGLTFSRRSVLLGSVAVFAGLRGSQQGDHFDNEILLVDGWVLARTDLEASGASPLVNLLSANAR